MDSVQEVLLFASEHGVYFYLKSGKLAYKAKRGSLSNKLKTAIYKYRVEIRTFLEENELSENDVLPPLKIADRQKELYLSYSQQRLWFIDQLAGSLQYNIQGHLFLQGDFDREAFQSTLNTLLERHEVLRTNFIMMDGEPRQVISNITELNFEELDLTIFSEKEKKSEVQIVKNKEAKKSFNLSRDLMIRINLIRISNDIQFILYTTHHIASDGWSSGILRREISTLYDAYRKNHKNPLNNLSFQYVDYAQWQRSWLQGEVLASKLNYWKIKLADLPQKHNLQLDKKRPKEQKLQGKAFNQVLDRKLSINLNKICAQYSVTLFILLESVFALLVSRYSNDSDVVIGTAVSGRDHKDLEGLIGFFVNSLILRSDLSGNQKFSEFLAANKQTIVDAYSYQHIPFEMIVEEIRPDRNISFNPLFQLFFVVQNTENQLPDVSIGGVEQGKENYSSIVDANVHFDIAVHVTEAGSDLLINWSYQDSIFSNQTILNMAKNYVVLLNSVISGLLDLNNETTFEKLDLINTKELESLSTTKSNKKTSFLDARCIHTVFEERANEFPRNIALVYQDIKMSYRELNEKSNQLAHYLISLGVRPDSIVALSVERSVESMIGMIGILKAGAAYLPLDPHYPQNRLDYMLSDSNAEIIITKTELFKKFKVTCQKVVCLDAPGFKSLMNTYPSSNMDVDKLKLSPNNIAYVIYSSGSTGVPKGVTVTHASVYNFIQCAMELFLNNSISGSIVSSPLAFDATVQSLYVPLFAGKYVEILPENELLINNLADCLLDDADRLLFKITPSHLNALSGYTYLKKNINAKHVVVIAGEILTQDIIKPWLELLPNVRFFNEYGPTEATVGSCAYCLNDEINKTTANSSIPIGHPFHNVIFYVLDANHQMQPIGVPGELYIGGAGLARGYFNKPALTALNFISDPFSNEPGKRLYATGDLVRYLHNGNLEFIGRKDSQIKLRGYRIELEEIECQLQKHERVFRSIVLIKKGYGELPYLVAYYEVNEKDSDYVSNKLKNRKSPQVPGENEIVSVDISIMLREHLALMLPEYMIPSVYISVEKWPLTPSGKIDKNALPEMEYKNLLHSKYTPPKNPVESLLVELWADLLQIKAESISTDDNFFALGGHSLLIMKLIAELQKNDIFADVREIFAAKTLADFACKIQESKGEYQYFSAPPNLIPDNCDEIRQEHLNLVKLSSFEISQIVNKIPGGIRNVKDIYPLIPTQEGMLFHHLLAPENDPYLLNKMFVVENKTLLDNLLNAVKCVIDRHDVLRTAIIFKNLSSPVQVVLNKVEMDVVRIKLKDEQRLKDKPLSLADNFSIMDLARAPLIRFVVASNKEEGPFYLHQQYHHIISDHIGNKIMWDEVESILNGSKASLEQPEPYRNFVAHTLFQSSRLDAKQYFSKQLEGIFEPTLMFDLAGMHDGFSVVRARAKLESRVALKIREISREFKMSPASIFHSAWAMVVSLCSNRNDIVFGTVLSGRLQGTAGATNMLGLFINTLPIRLKMDSLNCTDLVNMTDEILKSLLNYEQTSLSIAQGCSGISRDKPLFNSILNYRHSPSGKINDQLSENNQYIRAAGGGEGRNNYPVSIAVSDFGTEFDIKATITGNASAERVVDYFIAAITKLTDSLSVKSELPIYSLSLLSEEEYETSLRRQADSNVPIQALLCVHELFEEQVRKTPNSTALIYENKHISYQELNKRSNQLAWHLIELGVRPDMLVAISIERSLDAMIGLLGILKAGGAYVPLDPGYPPNRIQFMLDDCNARYIVTQSHLLEALKRDEQIKICIDNNEVKAALSKYKATEPQIDEYGMSTKHLAYVIYTSGSSGLPKGVAISHESVCNFLQYLRKYFLTPDIKGSVVSSPLAFDATVQSLYTPLCSGGYVKLLPDNDEIIDNLARQMMFEGEALLFKITPSHVKALLHQTSIIKNTAARHVFVIAGEMLNLELAGRWSDLFPNSKIINEYGPTEATVGSCVYVYDTEKANSQSITVPIGYPLSNVDCYVLNNEMQLLPAGVPGELYIGGAGLARGYLYQPKLTGERFIPNRYSSKPGCRLYKTGDLVRYLDNGDLEFLRRVDEQVKLRGFRVELGEIESQILKLNRVKDCVVVVQNAQDGEQKLVAYFVLQQSTAETEALKKQSDGIDYPAMFREHLQVALPGYMVPTCYMLLDAIPLTPSGKTDRKALPEPDVLAYSKRRYIAPNSPMEITIAKLWADLLDIDEKSIGAADNFFALGGHSIIAMKLMARLQALGVHTNIRTIFDTNSLSELAEVLSMDVEKTEVFEVPPNLIPIDCEQLRPEFLTLIELEQSKIDKLVSLVPGGAKNIKDVYPLAPLQEGILFHHLLDPNNDPYVLSHTLVLESEKRVDERLVALQNVIDRHDVLRTAFFTEGLSGPVQVVLRAVRLDVKRVQLEKGINVEKQLLALKKRWRQMALQDAPLIRVVIASTEDRTAHYFIQFSHHIISDHIGSALLRLEVEAFLLGEGERLQPSVPYRNFVAHTLKQCRSLEAKKYFTQQLSAISEPTLPFNIVNIYSNGSSFSQDGKVLETKLARQIREAARRLETSPACLFHAAWALVIAACSNSEKAVFGTVLSGRLHGIPGVENMLGLFMNTLPIKVSMRGRNVRQLIVELEMTIRELLKYEQTSLTVAQSCSSVSNGLPLFSAVLNYRHSSKKQTSSALAQQSEGVISLGSDSQTNYPFELSVSDWGDDFGIKIAVQQGVQASRIVGYFITAISRLTNALLTNEKIPVYKLSVLSDAEHKDIGINLNNTRFKFPQNFGIHDLFEEQVANTPDVIAIVSLNDQLSYNELNKRANCLAFELIRRGVSNEIRVGLCLDRSINMVVACLGILKAGGCYVPLDPQYPIKRLSSIITDSGLTLIVTHSDVINRLDWNELLEDVSNGNVIECLRIDELEAQQLDESYRLINPGVRSHPDQAAYMIYTSGTTGKPKGISVTHTGLISLLHWSKSLLSIKERQGVLASTSICFDLSAYEIFLPLSFGTQCILIDNVLTLSEFPERDRVTLLNAVPSAVKALLDGRQLPETLRVINLAGEPLKSELVDRLYEWGKEKKIFDLYGPSETTTYSTYALRYPNGVETIGRPVDNTSVYVLGVNGEIVPPGVIGELHIGGTGLSRGYHLKPSQTAGAFIPNPFCKKPGERLYRTGDYVCYLSDGNLQFIGRKDFQVKINGYRIELSEIERVAQQHERVSDIVVIPRIDSNNNYFLAAFVVVKRVEKIDNDLQGSAGSDSSNLKRELQKWIEKRLPSYMHSKSILLMEKLPLTINGKIDRKQLQMLNLALPLIESYQPPNTKTEKVLVSIWAKLLNIDSHLIGVSHNFFELGGHSLLAVRLMIEIREHFLHTVKIKMLFSNPDIASLALHIDSLVKLKEAIKQVSLVSDDEVEEQEW